MTYDVGDSRSAWYSAASSRTTSDVSLTLIRLAFTAVLLLLAAPLGAEAQRLEKVAKVGVLRSSDALQSYKIAAMQQGLSEYGHVAVIEGRYAEGKFDQLPALAADLVRMPVDVIVAPDNASAQAARKATRTIAIVLAGQGDPVGAGLVSSLARPGGNVTGVSAALGDAFPGKWVELVKEVLPRVSRVGAIFNPGNPLSAARFRQMEKAARTLGLKLQSLEVGNAADLETAFKALQTARAEALIVDADPVTLTLRTLIVDLAARARIPAMYGQHDFVEVGGLMAYGPNFREIYRQVGRCIGKILQGAKPEDLPVEQPTLLALVINLRTAKALGLAMPPSVLLRAENVE